MGVATMTPGPTNTAKRGESAPVVSVPFIRASDENIQGAGIDASRQISASSQDLGVFDVVAYGYVRYLVLFVTATGGAGAATGAEDGPWNVLQNLALTEPNGAYIAQFTSGYELYLANKYGGYAPPYAADPRHSPEFSAINAANGNFQYILRIPIEISGRDGLGALPNQDAAATFKLRLTIAPNTTVYSSVPATTQPTIRVRAWLESWDQPEASSGNAANQQTPPAVNTTQFWSTQVYTVNAGENTIQLKRVGNYIRQLAFVLRRAGTSRANGETDLMAIATDFRLVRDAFPVRFLQANVWRDLMYRRTGFGGVVGAEALTNELPGGLDNGVRFMDWMHEFDGGLGRENRDLWQPTLGSTRLEAQFNVANAGTLTVVTNDVAIAGQVFI